MALRRYEQILRTVVDDFHLFARFPGQQRRVDAEYRWIVLLAAKGPAGGALADGDLFVRQSKRRRDGVHHVEGALQRTEKLDAVAGAPGRHALRLKVHLLLQPRLPFSLHHHVGLSEPLPQIAALGVIMVNTVILAPDQLFAGRGLLYREYRRQRLYLNHNGGHRPFKALRIGRGDKSHSLRRVVYRGSGKSRIVAAHDGDIVFSGDILRRDQHRARLREGGKRFYLPHHAARHL